MALATEARPLVFTADPKLMARIEPLVRRVMIVDPNLTAARLLGDLMKGMGAREILMEPDEKRAVALARDFEPGLVFVERSGPRLDGEAFARRLRRSDLACRRVPIIMVTAEATATNIKGARDAGIHEFMVKPFTTGDLLRRVANVTLKPRDWVEAVAYVGPDRRRFNSGEYKGPQKRKADRAATAAEADAARTDQAARILRSALAQFDADPMQALRAMRAQAAALKATAEAAGETRLALAVAQLDAALAAPGATRQGLAAPVAAVLAHFPDLDAATLKKAG